MKHKELLDSACQPTGFLSQANAAKAFTDTEVPEGITGGQYRVLAHRGTQKTHGCEPVGIIFGTVPMAA